MTGLVVVDTGTYFTPFGQAVVLLLIQVGGLGFMAVTTMLFLALRARVSPGAYAAGGRHRLWANSRGCPFKPTHCGPYHGLRKLGALLLSIRFVPLYGWGKGSGMRYSIAFPLFAMPALT